MNGEYEQPAAFPLVVWSACLTLGALRGLPEPFTRPTVVYAQAKTSAPTPALSRHSRGARVKRVESPIRKFFYEPLGHVQIEKGLKG